MQAAAYNISIDQGSDFSLNMTWKNDAGTPINLTGYSARMQIRKSYASEVRLNVTETTGIALGGTAGTIIISLSATQTSAISVDYPALVKDKDAKQYQPMLYDLELTAPTGVVTRLLQGSANIYPVVTR